MKVTQKAVIYFNKDYNDDGKWQKKVYTIADGHGNKENIDVAIADGSSIEFLMVKTYKALRYAGRRLNWNAAAYFSNLEQVLMGKALQYYEQEVAIHYPNAVDKTMQNYRELCKRIITRLSPYSWPGNHIYTDMKTNIEYENCLDDDGEQMAPNDILLRMEQMAALGRDMHHTHGNTYMNAHDMKRAFFNIFSDDMQEWLTHVQGIDPMDPAQQMVAQHIADEFQHHWKLAQSKKIREQEKDDNKKRKWNNDDSDYDSDDSSEDTDESEDDNSEMNNGGESNNDHGYSFDDDNEDYNKKKKSKKIRRKRCPIFGHEDHHHTWRTCFLNKHNPRCDHEAAERFYRDEAHGDQAWYRDTYTKAMFNERRRNNNGNGSQNQRYQNQGQNRDNQGYYYNGYDY